MLRMDGQGENSIPAHKYSLPEYNNFLKFEWFKDEKKALKIQAMKKLGHQFSVQTFPEVFIVIWFWFDFCFTALQHILGHFGRGELP